jgi:hypothetical protein
MYSISRRSAPIRVIVHYPKTEDGKRELATQAAGVHADVVQQTIQKLNCSSKQKMMLLDEIIKTASIPTKKAGDQTQ